MRNNGNCPPWSYVEVYYLYYTPGDAITEKLLI